MTPSNPVPPRTLEELREWAGNRADKSAGRGKPEVFEAWREMVDCLDALLVPPVVETAQETGESRSDQPQPGSINADQRDDDRG